MYIHIYMCIYIYTCTAGDVERLEAQLGYLFYIHYIIYIYIIYVFIIYICICIYIYMAPATWSDWRRSLG